MVSIPKYLPRKIGLAVNCDLMTFAPVAPSVIATIFRAMRNLAQLAGILRYGQDRDLTTQSDQNLEVAICSYASSVTSLESRSRECNHISGDSRDQCRVLDDHIPR